MYLASASTVAAYNRVRGHGHGLHPDEIPSLLEDDETVLEENAVIIAHPNTYTPLCGYLSFPGMKLCCGRSCCVHWCAVWSRLSSGVAGPA